MERIRPIIRRTDKKTTILVTNVSMIYVRLHGSDLAYHQKGSPHAILHQNSLSDRRVRPPSQPHERRGTLRDVTSVRTTVIWPTVPILPNLSLTRRVKPYQQVWREINDVLGVPWFTTHMRTEPLCIQHETQTLSYLLIV